MGLKTTSDLTENEKTLVDVLWHCLSAVSAWKYSERKDMDALITSYAADLGPYTVEVQKDVAPQDTSGIERIFHSLIIRKGDATAVRVIEHAFDGQLIKELYDAMASKQ